MVQRKQTLNRYFTQKKPAPRKKSDLSGIGNAPNFSLYNGSVPFTAQQTNTTSMEYEPSNKEWISDYRNVRGRRYTRFRNGFEACTIYNKALSLGEGDDKAKPLDYVEWKDRTPCTDWRRFIGKSKFAKYRTTVPFDAKPGDDLYVWWYDADYSMHNGSLMVNLYGVTQEGTSVLTRLTGFKPYMYVGIPDSWVEWCLRKGELTEDALLEELEKMVRRMHNVLETAMASQCGESYKFKEFAKTGFLHPLPEGRFIESGVDVLGYCKDSTTYMYKLEVNHPQIIPEVRELLWNPLGGAGLYNRRVDPWLCVYQDHEDDSKFDSNDVAALVEKLHTFPKPNGVTTIARSDRMWLHDKEMECMAQGKRFDPMNYTTHPERKLFNSFYKPNNFGTDVRFSVYECNVDFIVRYITKEQNLVGWCKISDWDFVPAESTESMMDEEIFVHHKNVVHLTDPNQCIEKDPKTKNFVRELTHDEQVAEVLYSKPPNVEIASFDAEMISRWPNFPNARFCPIISWGVRAFNKQTNKSTNYFFCLASKPSWIKDAIEHKCLLGRMWEYRANDTDVYFYYENETDMLQELCLFYAEMRFHFHIGWNSNGFDIPYLIRRCQTLGIKEAKNVFQMVHTRTTKWKYSFIKNSRVPSIQVVGSVPLDLMLYMRSTKNDWRAHSLNYASEKLLKKHKVELDYAFIELCQMTSEKSISLIHAYLKGDIELPQECFDADKVFDTLCSFTEVQFCTFQHLISKGAQLKVYAGILGNLEKKARERGVPFKLPWHPRKSKEEEYEKYQGAHVFSPEVGYYGDDCPVGTLDFASLYPSEMMKHNLCYSTLLTEWAIRKFGLVEGKDYWRCPDFKFHKTKNPDGSVSNHLELIRNPHNPAFIKEEVSPGIIPNLERDLKKFRNKAKHVMIDSGNKVENMRMQINGLQAEHKTMKQELSEETERNLAAPEHIESQTRTPIENAAVEKNESELAPQTDRNPKRSRDEPENESPDKRQRVDEPASERNPKRGREEPQEDASSKRQRSDPSAIQNRIAELETTIKKLMYLINIHIGVRDKYNALQNAIKIYMNSIYGFFGATDSLCPLLCAAVTITTMGQIDIKKVQIFIEKECTVANGYIGNAHVIYGDTDSVMFILKDWTSAPNRPEFMALSAHLAKRITKEVFNYGLILEFEKIYIRYALMRKKRYAGLKFEEDYSVYTDYKGVKPKRKDSMPSLDRAFRVFLEEAIQARNVDKAIDIIAEIFDSIAAKTASLNELKCSCSLSKDLADAYVPGKDGRIHVTKGMAMATKQLQRTGRDGYAGDRFTFVVREQRAFSSKKKDKEATTARLEDPDEMRKTNTSYDPEYYTDSMLKNMGQAFEHLVPHGMAELKDRWINRRNMRKRKIEVSSDSALAAVGCKRVRRHCSGCSSSVYTAHESAGLQTAGADKTTQNIIIEYGGEETRLTVPYESDSIVCEACRSDPNKKYYAKTRLEDTHRLMVNAWNKCQQCPSKDMGGDIIMQCKAIDCPNYHLRTETVDKYNRSLEYARLFDW